MAYKRITLKPKREASLLRRHPWVFSGGVGAKDDDLSDGDLVEVYSKRGDFLGTGHYTNGSIMVRVLSFEKTSIDHTFWENKFQKAFDYRSQLGLLDDPSTNCFRLIHAEGDGLPGLIIDLYGDTAVIQCHAIGMYQQIDTIAAALVKVSNGLINNVYQKSKETLPAQFARSIQNDYLIGGTSEGIVLENGHQFIANWETGQKTGFFLDQRNNRNRLADFVKDKTVLNTFCYTGGFSVYALAAGASQVDSVDISSKAMVLTDQNIALNAYAGQHQSITADVLPFFKELNTEYDVIVVDPPAFAKNLKKRHNAVQGYKRLNALALRKVKSGGFLFTFSCSQVVGRQLFQDTMVAAALEAGRKVRIVEHLGQPADHPVNLFHPEGSYLKGLILYVE